MASKYFIFNNIVWMGSRSTLPQTAHKHVRTPLPPSSATGPPEYDPRPCSCTDIRPFLLMKVSMQQMGRYKTVSSAFVSPLLSLSFYSLLFFLRWLINSSSSIPTASQPAILNHACLLLRFKWIFVRMEATWQKAKHACHTIWIWRTCLPLRDVLIETAYTGILF